MELWIRTSSERFLHTQGLFTWNHGAAWEGPSSARKVWTQTADRRHLKLKEGLLFRIWGQNKGGLYAAGSPWPRTPPHPCATASRPQNVSTRLLFILSLSPFSTLQGPTGVSGAKGDMVKYWCLAGQILKMTSTVAATATVLCVFILWAEIRIFGSYVMFLGCGRKWRFTRRKWRTCEYILHFAVLETPETPDFICTSGFSECCCLAAN